MRRWTPILEALASGGLLVLAACSRGQSADEAEAAAASAAAIASASAASDTAPPAGSELACGPHTTFLAFVGPEQCSSRVGVTGRWLARSIFPHAPARVMGCRFTWEPAAGATSVPPEIDALSTLAADHLTAASGGACSDLSPPEVPARLRPPTDGGEVGPPTGVTGCDVCAQLHDRAVFVILPANAPELRTLLVSTSDGRLSTFDLASPAGAQVFSVTLPRLAAGVTYQAEDIRLISSPH